MSDHHGSGNSSHSSTCKTRSDRLRVLNVRSGFAQSSPRIRTARYPPSGSPSGYHPASSKKPCLASRNNRRSSVKWAQKPTSSTAPTGSSCVSSLCSTLHPPGIRRGWRFALLREVSIRPHSFDRHVVGRTATEVRPQAYKPGLFNSLLVKEANSSGFIIHENHQGAIQDDTGLRTLVEQDDPVASHSRVPTRLGYHAQLYSQFHRNEAPCRLRGLIRTHYASPQGMTSSPCSQHLRLASRQSSGTIPSNPLEPE